MGVTSPRLLLWAAVHSQSQGTGLGWSWQRRMFLPCAGGAGLSRAVVPVWQELVHPCEERNRESLWEQQGFIQRLPVALCNGEISWDPQELGEGQVNPQKTSNLSWVILPQHPLLLRFCHCACVVGHLGLLLFLAMCGGQAWRGGKALLAPEKLMVSIPFWFNSLFPLPPV